MRTRGTETTPEDASPDRRRFPRRLRSLSIVFLAALLSASVAASWTVRGLVREYEHVLLKERAAEVNLVVGNLPYAAVLMDCQMPVLNGYEATAEIRERERQTPDRHVPIVALTASAIKGDEERCLEAGMDAYVTKPVTVVALGEVLGRLIQPATDVLDRETVDGLSELGGDTPALLEELADTFIEGAPAQIAALTGAAARSDLDTVARGRPPAQGQLRRSRCPVDGSVGRSDRGGRRREPPRAPAGHRGPTRAVVRVGGGGAPGRDPAAAARPALTPPAPSLRN